MGTPLWLFFFLREAFLAGNHKLGVSHATEYKIFVVMCADFVEDRWQNLHGALFNMPALETLPNDQREITLLLIASAHDIFEKHVLPRDGFTFSTNRVGETILQYMHASFHGNKNTRMVLIADQFIGNRSQYVAYVIEDPTTMEECMTRVSTRLASKECR